MDLKKKLFIKIDKLNIFKYKSIDSKEQIHFLSDHEFNQSNLTN